MVLDKKTLGEICDEAIRTLELYAGNETSEAANEWYAAYTRLAQAANTLSLLFMVEEHKYEKKD